MWALAAVEGGIAARVQAVFGVELEQAIELGPLTTVRWDKTAYRREINAQA